MRVPSAPLRALPWFQLRPISPPPLWGICRPRPRVLDSRVAKSNALGVFYLFSCSGGRVADPGQGFRLGQGQGSRELARGRTLSPATLATGRRTGEATSPESVLSLRPTQCSSFMNRRGLCRRVRWAKDSDAEPEWGKGPIEGRRRALALLAFLTT